MVAREDFNVYWFVACSSRTHAARMLDFAPLRARSLRIQHMGEPHRAPLALTHDVVPVGAEVWCALRAATFDSILKMAAS